MIILFIIALILNNNVMAQVPENEENTSSNDSIKLNTTVLKVKFGDITYIGEAWAIERAKDCVIESVLQHFPVEEDTAKKGILTFKIGNVVVVWGDKFARLYTSLWVPALIKFSYMNIATFFGNNEVTEDQFYRFFSSQKESYIAAQLAEEKKKIDETAQQDAVKEQNNDDDNDEDDGESNEEHNQESNNQDGEKKRVKRKQNVQNVKSESGKKQNIDEILVNVGSSKYTGPEDETEDERGYKEEEGEFEKDPGLQLIMNENRLKKTPFLEALEKRYQTHSWPRKRGAFDNTYEMIIKINGMDFFVTCEHNHYNFYLLLGEEKIRIFVRHCGKMEYFNMHILLELTKEKMNVVIKNHYNVLMQRLVRLKNEYLYPTYPKVSPKDPVFKLKIVNKENDCVVYDTNSEAMFGLSYQGEKVMILEGKDLKKVKEYDVNKIEDCIEIIEYCNQKIKEVNIEFLKKKTKEFENEFKKLFDFPSPKNNDLLLARFEFKSDLVNDLNQKIEFLFQLRVTKDGKIFFGRYETNYDDKNLKSEDEKFDISFSKYIYIELIKLLVQHKVKDFTNESVAFEPKTEIMFFQSTDKSTGVIKDYCLKSKNIEEIDQHEKWYWPYQDDGTVLDKKSAIKVLHKNLDSRSLILATMVTSAQMPSSVDCGPNVTDEYNNYV